MKNTIKKNTVITATTFLFLFLLWKSFAIFLPHFSYKTWKLSHYSKIITFNHDGKMIAYATGELIERQINPNPGMRDNVSDTSKVEIRRVNSGKLIQSFDFFAASSIAFSPDNSLIAMGGYGGEIEIWRIKDRKLLYSFRDEGHYSYETLLLSFSPDGKTFIAAVGDSSYPISSRPGQVSVRNLSEGQKKYTLSERYSCAASSPDGQLFALSGDSEIPLTIHRVNDGSIVRQIEKNKYICSDLKFSADNQLLVFEDKPGSGEDIQIHRVKDSKLLHRMSVREAYRERESLSDFALSPNNRYLATSYRVVYQSSLFINSPTYPKALFGSIRIWNIENERRIATLWGHRKGTNEIAISPNGKLLVSLGKDRTIKFWKMPPRNYGWVWLLATCGLAVLVHCRKNTLED
ncbi:MAG: hypothetical protein AAF383_11920 [Cyanobacteria bacterium P01_A01_bin.83]